ncbi:hypothetical protein, partial [Salmonella sp. SAL4355]|uniref:hypothetical protein n=1 Tax=Salmonella sp. SAL4355 TaxID=3159876 RepID=UPI003979626C
PETLRERLDEVLDQRGGAFREVARKLTGPTATPVGMTGQHEQRGQSDDGRPGGYEARRLDFGPNLNLGKDERQGEEQQD